MTNTSSVLRSIAPYLEEWATFQAEYRGATGLQLAVTYQGEILVDLAWGRANVETGEKLTSDHLFRIASHSKTMTAMITMRLVETGGLRLDDAVGDYIEDLAESHAASVTVRELLGHQGGIIRDSSDADFWQRHRPFLDREQIIDVVQSEGVVFAPNQHFKYSNIGYSLLGLILEAASGKSYQQLSTEHIIDPLGLTRTGSEHDPDRADEYAAGHTGRTAYGDSPRVINHVDTRAMSPATGWYSTARELASWGVALVEGSDTLLSDASRRLIRREESTVKVRGKEQGRYGLGVALGKVGDRELIGHSGGYPGHITLTWIDPTEGLVVSALTNSIDGPAAVVGEGVVQLINLALKAVDEEPAPMPPELEFAGRFANLWGVVDVVDLGGILHVLNPRLPNPDSAHSRLIAENGRIINEPVPGYATAGETVTVRSDDSGTVTAINLGAMTAWPIEEYRSAMSAEQPGTILERLAL